MPQLYTEPITGYRTWLMEPDKLELTGVIHRLVWTPGDHSHAECRKNISPSGKVLPGKRRSRHMVPSMKCQCGFWAYSDLSYMKTSTNYCWGSMIKSVRGVIIAQGRIQLTSKGFRAEYAKPIALQRWLERKWTPAPTDPENKGKLEVQRKFWNEQLERIAEHYEIPLVDDEKELVKLANKYGTPIAS
jgi:hypothetical protein